ncbi:MAG: hypothetical protein ACPH4K_06620 [Flavobacteriaceae bacterium]
MNTYAERKDQKQIEASKPLNVSTGQGSIQSYKDNRTEVVSQMKLQEMADNSPGVMQLQTYQKMADEHTKTPENNSNGEVTQLMGTGLFGRFARPMARGAARLCTGLSIADAGLDARKKFNNNDFMGAAMAVRGGAAGLVNNRAGHAMSAASNLRDGDYGQAAFNATGVLMPGLRGLPLAAGALSTKNIMDNFPFDKFQNPVEY